MNLKTILGRPAQETAATEETPEPETAEPAGSADTASAGPNDAGGPDELPPHFAEIDVDGDGEGLGFRPGGAAEGDGAAAPPISPDVFYANFAGCFKIGGMVTGLQSLPIHPSEEEKARAASDAFYEICKETPALRFLLDPQSVWAKRIVAIGAFAWPKYQYVTAELAARAGEAAAAESADDESGAADPLAGLPESAPA